jgi:hypothetical protein
MSTATPEPPVLAGDWADDDHQVIDDQLQENPNPPAPPVQTMVEPVEKRPKRVRRLLCGTLSIEPGWVPVQVLTADSARCQVVIQVNSETATDGVLVADDAGKLQTGVGAGAVYPANQLSLLDFTGPVFIAPLPNASGAVPVSWWAVTE